MRAAADNAEKDAVVKALHAKVAELEEKAAANAARSRDELAQMAKATPPRLRRRKADQSHGGGEVRRRAQASAA